MLPRRHGVGRPSRPIDYEEVLETRMPKEGSFDQATCRQRPLDLAIPAVRLALTSGGREVAQQ